METGKNNLVAAPLSSETSNNNNSNASLMNNDNSIDAPLEKQNLSEKQPELTDETEQSQNDEKAGESSKRKLMDESNEDSNNKTSEVPPSPQEVTPSTNSSPTSKTNSLPPRPIKRARTAYFIFADEKRSEIQAKHPGEGVASIARALGHLWAAMADEEKEKYQQQAAQERERVNKALEEWKAAGGTDMPLSRDAALQQSSKDPTALIFPLGRIRKICKLDPEVKGMSKEALLLITKCAELATAKLGTESVKVAQVQNRRKLLPDDVAQVCRSREQFLFLREDIKDLVQEQIQIHQDEATAKKGNSAKAMMMTTATPDVAAAAVGSKPLTSYFTVAKKS